jgi:hypothetical protein
MDRMKRKLQLAPGLPVGPDDDVGIPVLTLWVRTRYGDFADVPFVVDTGADCTSMPASFAQSKGIPFSRAAANRGLVSGLVGSVERYRGSIQVRIGAELFDWPCDFLLAPPPAAARRRIRPPVVLGRAGFLSDFAVCLDDATLTIERRPHSGWQRLRRLFVPRLARWHPYDTPL